MLEDDLAGNTDTPEDGNDRRSVKGARSAGYSSPSIVARRHRILNETRKMPGWDAEVPEMNHNEMVGWAGGGSRFSAVFLHTASDAPRNRMRMELNAPAVRAHGTHVAELHAHGASPLALPWPDP